MTSKTLGAWLNSAKARLAAGVEEPRLEAQVMAGHLLERPRAWLLTHPEVELDENQTLALEQMLEARLAGQPLPYLLGHWEFFGLDFKVSPAVLIPRPETELLVETALDWLKRHPGRRAVDVGTGSGCIAVSLALHCPRIEVYAVDISRQALRVAFENVGLHQLEDRVHLWQGSLLTAARGPFDLLCANLPYIPSAKVNTLAVAAHEPRLALDGGEDGLDLVGALLADAPAVMAAGGLMLLEIESGQGESAVQLARQKLPGAVSAVHNDLAGLPRFISVELP